MKVYIASVLLLLFIALNVVQSFAATKILVVTDIDDTIKVSHILDSVDSASNATKVENHFLGMSQAFQILQAENESVKFAYVSNAPRFPMEQAHNFFLRYNDFPEGKLYLRDSFFDDQFKLDTIRRLLKTVKPEHLVLIGDNGELDVEVYQQIENEFPQISTTTFIHQLYSERNSSETGKKLTKGQFGFVTSLDLLLKWNQLAAVSKEKIDVFASKVVPEFLRQDPNADIGEIAFPAWMDCRDYLIPENSEASLKKYFLFLKKRCSIEPVY